MLEHLPHELLHRGDRHVGVGRGATALLSAPPPVDATTSQQAGGYQSYPDMQLYERYGLLNLSRKIRRKPLWATRA